MAAQFRKQDDFCQKCHDQENDVNWVQRPFQQTWGMIQHYTPVRANGAAPVPGIQIEAAPK